MRWAYVNKVYFATPLMLDRCIYRSNKTFSLSQFEFNCLAFSGGGGGVFDNYGCGRSTISRGI